MATIVTGLSTISAVHGRLFFGTNLAWPHEVFIEVLALGGEACQQVSGVRDMTEVPVLHENQCKLLLTAYLFHEKKKKVCFVCLCFVS